MQAVSRRVAGGTDRNHHDDCHSGRPDPVSGWSLRHRHRHGRRAGRSWRSPSWDRPPIVGSLGRGLDSGAYPWLAATGAVIWGFGIITCTVSSRVPSTASGTEFRASRQLGQYVLERESVKGEWGRSTGPATA